MPIYEFYCHHCHRVLSFLSRAVNVEKTPACPRCGQEGLARRASAFAISKGRKEEPKPEAPPGPDIDESRLEKAMEALAGDLDSMDENDPAGRPPHAKALLGDRHADRGGDGRSAQAHGVRRGPRKDRRRDGGRLRARPRSAVYSVARAASRPGRGKSDLRRLRRMLPPAHDPELFEM